MPRQSTLSDIQPNKFYKVTATVKYQHIGEDFITAIIQQDNVQKKILIPKNSV